VAGLADRRVIAPRLYHRRCAAGFDQRRDIFWKPKSLESIEKKFGTISDLLPRGNIKHLAGNEVPADSEERPPRQSSFLGSERKKRLRFELLDRRLISRAMPGEPRSLRQHRSPSSTPRSKACLQLRSQSGGNSGITSRSAHARISTPAETKGAGSSSTSVGHDLKRRPTGETQLGVEDVLGRPRVP